MKSKADNTSAPKAKKNKLLHWLTFRPWWGFFHLVMYAAAYFPKSWVPQEDLISPESLQKIREEFEEDWQQVRAYAGEHNPR